jgi:hypothetical protein
MLLNLAIQMNRASHLLALGSTVLGKRRLSETHLE